MKNLRKTEQKKIRNQTFFPPSLIRPTFINRRCGESLPTDRQTSFPSISRFLRDVLIGVYVVHIIVIEKLDSGGNGNIVDDPV